ncbi:hypothetical protein KSD_04250 [Ktedonobacter sp. SOSP1-85]|nr:hypothetical protein KSD_04250 [Ktedonobacter sp. SOSP1-85]
MRFARRRFGHYDLIDFVVVLLGYAISSERTLETFYESLRPFAAPFMALFGRERLPHRSTLSRFLAALDQAPVEALRTVFLEDLVARPLEKETLYVKSQNRERKKQGERRRSGLPCGDASLPHQPRPRRAPTSDHLTSCAALTWCGLQRATHTGSRERGGGLRQTLERRAGAQDRLTVCNRNTAGTAWATPLEHTTSALTKDFAVLSVPNQA